MTIVINLVGAAGIGKSQISARIFSEFKKKGLSVEYIPEHVKHLIYKRKYEKLKNQWQITYNQFKMIDMVQDKVDYAICDSPLFLSLFYNRVYEDNHCNVSKTEKYILSKMKKHKNIYIYLKRNLNVPYETANRVHTYDQAVECDAKMLDLLQEFNIKYYVYDMCEYENFDVKWFNQIDELNIFDKYI